MKVRDLKELLETVPDYFDVALQIVVGDDTTTVEIVGKSDKRWSHEITLVAGQPHQQVTLA